MQATDGLERWLRVLTEQNVMAPFTLEESLAHLVRKGLISTEDARARTGHSEELEGLLR